MNDTLVYFITSKTCNHIGLPHNSKNKHAANHFLDTGYPVIQSFEPGESWVYCYIDELYIESL